MKRPFLTLGLIGFHLVIFSQTTAIEPAIKDLADYKIPARNSTVPPLPDSFILFGEKVPLEIWDVRERLDREILINTYLHGTALYILKLYTRWIPMIEEQLSANNIPDDFKYLCIAESALQNLISKAGATGFWQFMRSSAPAYGLEVNNEVDERYHVEKSTNAACKYLKIAYDKFGSWTAAAASYNCGMGGYANAVSLQETADYYKLLLPEETMRYIFRIMALKYIFENPERSGFIILKEQQYSPLNLKKVEITSPVSDLVKFAADNNTDYKTLKILNPWLRSSKLSNKYRKTYTLLLPAD